MQEIGKEKLVVVVSHDREFAEKHGDRIIELKDGEVVFDSTNLEKFQSKKESHHEEILLPIQNTKKGLSTAIALKMGTSNLLQEKVRTILTLLLAILTTTLMSVAFVYGTMKSEISLSKLITDNHISQIIVYQNSYKKPVVLSSKDHMNDKAFLEMLNDKNSIKSAGYNNHYIIGSKQQMLDFGFEFIFAEEISNDTVYCMDYRVNGNNKELSKLLQTEHLMICV